MPSSPHRRLEPADPNPSSTRTPADRWRRRIVVGVVSVVAVVTIGLVGVAWHIDRSLQRVEVTGLAHAATTADAADDQRASSDRAPRAEPARAPGSETDPEPPEGIDDVLTVLIMGSDDRSTLSPDERNQLGVGEADGERTEAIILARIDPTAPDGPDVQVLRFPRDLVVERCDGSVGRINAAFAIGEDNGTGGASCLVQTLTDWSGIAINHAIKVDFAGFVELVDAVGGVTVEVPEPLNDAYAGLDVPAGAVHLDGPGALAYVRARQVDDDFGRISRQDQLLAALVDEVATPALVTDPIRSLSLLDTAVRALEIDDRLTRSELRRLGVTATEVRGQDLTSRTVPGTPALLNDQHVLRPEADVARELFEAFERGELASVEDTVAGS